MRRLIVSLFGIIMPWLMPAARDINGTVMDSDSVAIEFANVAAFACDSIVGGGMTDAAGTTSQLPGRYSFTSGKKFRTSKIEKNADTSRLAKD